MIRTVLRVRSNRLPEIARRLPSKADQVVRKAAFDVEGEMKGSMLGNGPSAPGEPPAIDTGNLVNSIQTTQVSDAHWRVTVGADYGVYLEYGTIFMEPRPFRDKAVDAVRPSFISAMRGLERLLA